MNRSLKILAFLLAITCLCTPLFSCVKTPVVTPDHPDNSDTPDPNSNNTVVTPTLSALTGLSAEGDLNARPVAVMIDNELNYRSYSLYCLGLSNADIVYETNIEANYSGTRIMAIFSQAALTKTEKVGSVRSARPYYMTLAKMLDAFYVHEGVSNPDEAYPSSRADDLEYARGLLEAGYIENYYLNLDSVNSYRDSDLRQKIGTVEAAQVAYGDKTVDYLNNRYERQTYENAQKSAFLFGENKLEAGKPADGVQVTFANWNAYYTQSDFLYDETTGLYEKGQYIYGAMKTRLVPTDLVTGETLKYKNVFVLVTKQHAIDKEWANPGNDYHIKIDLVGHEGKGYYFTEGRYIEITWKCESDTSPMKFYTADGKELVVNPGKSYVNLIHENALDRLRFVGAPEK